MSYKTIVPRSQLVNYGPGTEVSFDLLHDGESLEPGSVWITFDLKLVSASQDASLEHYMDIQAGCSALLENVITKCDVFNEVISNYGRLAKHNAMMQYSPDQLTTGISHTGELRVPDLNMMPVILDSGIAADQVLACTHKMLIGLNSMSGALGSDKSGRIALSFKLVSIQKAFFGSSQVPGNQNGITNYSLQNIQLHYKTRMGLQSGPVVVNVVQDTQKLVQSSKTTIQNTFPLPVSQILVSFADTQTESNPTLNTLICQQPPLTRVSWVYNDVSNGLVAYNLETQEEFSLSGLSVMRALGCGTDLKQQFALTAQSPGYSKTDMFALGLAIGRNTDFSRSGVGLSVELAPIGNTQYYAYFYAYGQLQIV